MSTTLYDRIANKSVRIALVNPDQAGRVAMNKVLHAMGYRHTVLCGSIKELHEHMREGPIDWVLSTLLPDPAFNMAALLRSYYEDGTRDKIRVSYLIGGDQRRELPAAFAEGLISCFALDRMENATTMRADLEEFFQILKDAKDKNLHEAFVAAEYLRRYLKKQKRWADWVALEKALCNNFPLKAEHLLRLAEAHFAASEYGQGRLLAQQIGTLAAGAGEAAAAFFQKFPESMLERQGSIAERFEVKSVMVIERDAREVQILRQALLRIGIPQLREYSSFTEAWDALQQDAEPDLIISEWSSRKGDLSTPQFLQRIRAEGRLTTPLLVMINKLREPESQLLTDVQVIQMLQKPLREDHAVMSLAFAIQQSKLPTERKPMEQRILNCLLAGERAEAYCLRKLYLASASIPPSRKYYIEAVFNYHHHSYTKARNFLIKGIKLSITEKASDEVKPNLDKTVLLAKCLFRLGDKTVAIQMMDKAKDRSPYNVSILTMLMEMNYDVGNIFEAEAAIAAAHKIDPGNAQVMQAGARLSLLLGRVDRAAEYLRSVGNLNEIITRMNNQAVSFIQKGELQRGIDLYRSAIQSLPAQERDYLGVVHYNLALAYLRHGAIDSGLESLQKSAAIVECRVHRRASSLIKKILESRLAGRSVKFSNLLAGPDTEREAFKLAGLKDDLLARRVSSVALRGLYQPKFVDRPHELRTNKAAS